MSKSLSFNEAPTSKKDGKRNSRKLTRAQRKIQDFRQVVKYKFTVGTTVLRYHNNVMIFYKYKTTSRKCRFLQNMIIKCLESRSKKTQNPTRGLAYLPESSLTTPQMKYFVHLDKNENVEIISSKFGYAQIRHPGVVP